MRFNPAGDRPRPSGRGCRPTFTPEERTTYKALLGQAQQKLTEEELRAVSQNRYQLGIVAALEEEVKYLREKSGNLYAEKKDAEAKIVRDMADDLERRAAEQRRLYHANFPR